MNEIDLTARSEDSVRDLLRPVALAIKSGSLTIIPTTTYYALAADALNPDAVHKVFAAKRRDPAKPLIVLVDSFGMAAVVAAGIDPRVKKLDWRLGSRGLTYVLPAAPGLPAELTAGGGTVAVRVERNEVVQEVLSLTGTPVTGTSANVEGAAPPTRLDDALVPMRDWVDVAVRWWPSRTTAATTIVDLTSDEASIVREGSVSSDEVFRALAAPGF